MSDQKEHSDDFTSIDELSLADFGTHMLFDEIDSNSAKEVCEFVLKGNLVFGKNDRLNVYINSGGGSCTDGFAIIDFFESSSVPISTRAVGAISSMATLIFVAGTKGHRIMSKNAEVMIHQFGNSGMDHTKYHELLAIRKVEDRLHDVFIQHFKRHTKMTEKQIRDVILGPSDAYLTPEECLKYGICDYIADPYEMSMDVIKKTAVKKGVPNVRSASRKKSPQGAAAPKKTAKPGAKKERSKKK